jgi:hypothetical protein
MPSVDLHNTHLMRTTCHCVAHSEQAQKRAVRALVIAKATGAPPQAGSGGCSTTYQFAEPLAMMPPGRAAGDTTAGHGADGAAHPDRGVNVQSGRR